MRDLAIIFASITFSALIVLNVPMSWFELFKGNNFGSTSITTIQGSDTLSSSRTTINNNFSSLNSNKLEIESFAATTSHSKLASLAALASIGTITTGVWNGTAIPVAYGGTGTTTPSSNQVILGNTTSGFKVVGGYGNSGQTLTSNGTGAAPTWQSISFDTSADFVNTGEWFFRNGATSTDFAILNTLFWNGVRFSMSSSTPASSTVAMLGANNKIFWLSPGFRATAAPTAADSSSGSTTKATISVPANTVAPGVPLRITANFASQLGTCYYGIAFGGQAVGFGRSGLGTARIDVLLTATSSSRQVAFSTSDGAAGDQVVVTPAGGDSFHLAMGSHPTQDLTGAVNVTFITNAKASEGPCEFNGGVVEALTSI